ncbi:malate synthase A [Varibaculum cambriense]|uniref:malate synthase A n=1 Tax=Varibaculum cambriense TaxID=184870 RepID=UPI002903E6A7|nr:malate synthase A [Varibaculum cambriense]MDU1223472.1 malate synthase A [Varibaculum cambriense]
MNNRTDLTEGKVEVRYPQHEDPGTNLTDRFDEILTDEALEFLRQLQLRFGATRAELLKARHDRRQRLANGYLPHFLKETKNIREDKSWKVAPIAPGLEDRRVEITGPTERKMTINALNCGAKCWLADMEDANTPHFTNVIGGQVNLYDAIRRTIEYTNPSNGKHYQLNEGELPTIIVRPRGWHLTEKHIRIGGHSSSGSLTDFGLYFFHNAKELIKRGSGPYYYLPKMESHLEARLWAEVFSFSEEYLGIPHGTIRATCLIETIMGVFEMDEILYELRDYSSGLNAGRWDYIFSAIKKFRDSGPSWVLPDRSDITMQVPFMHAYTELLVKTCHQRGAHAIGGMSAFIPSKDPAVNAESERKVREDKTREVEAGFDGSWVAHPGMVGYVREVFDGYLKDRPNQVDRQRDDVNVTAKELLDFASTPGAITEAGVRTNVAVGLRYLYSWLGGNGAAAIYGLMEDAATAEISRSQIWQWLRYQCELDDGRKVTPQLVAELFADEYGKFLEEVGEAGKERAEQSARIFKEVCMQGEFPTFLTVPVYANELE